MRNWIISVATLGLVAGLANAECDKEVSEYNGEQLHVTTCTNSSFQNFTGKLNMLQFGYNPNTGKWSGRIYFVDDNADWWKCPEATRNPYAVMILGSVDGQPIEFKSTRIAPSFDFNATGYPDGVDIIITIDNAHQVADKLRGKNELFLLVQKCYTVRRLHYNLGLAESDD